MKLSQTLRRAVTTARPSLGGKPPPFDAITAFESFFRVHAGNQPPEHYGHWLTPADRMKIANGLYGPRRQGHFHPSAGLLPETCCPRQAALDLICAPRDESVRMPDTLALALDIGTMRHVAFHIRGIGMAHYKWKGIESYRYEEKLKHPTLPIEGSADGIFGLISGHSVLVDYKTASPKNFELLRDAKEHQCQLNVYLGLAGLERSYVLNENKANGHLAHPASSFRIDFDPKLWDRQQGFVRELTEAANDGKIPRYNEETCKGSIMLCAYQNVCSQLRAGKTTVVEADQRSPELLQLHRSSLRPSSDSPGCDLSSPQKLLSLRRKTTR